MTAVIEEIEHRQHPSGKRLQRPRTNLPALPLSTGKHSIMNNFGAKEILK